jgi:hypothetical protein
MASASSCDIPVLTLEHFEFYKDAQKDVKVPIEINKLEGVGFVVEKVLPWEDIVLSTLYRAQYQYIESIQGVSSPSIMTLSKRHADIMCTIFNDRRRRYTNSNVGNVAAKSIMRRYDEFTKFSAEQVRSVLFVEKKEDKECFPAHEKQALIHEIAVAFRNDQTSLSITPESAATTEPSAPLLTLPTTLLSSAQPTSFQASALNASSSSKEDSHWHKIPEQCAGFLFSVYLGARDTKNFQLWLTQDKTCKSEFRNVREWVNELCAMLREFMKLEFGIDTRDSVIRAWYRNHWDILRMHESNKSLRDHFMGRYDLWDQCYKEWSKFISIKPEHKMLNSDIVLLKYMLYQWGLPESLVGPECHEDIARHVLTAYKTQCKCSCPAAVAYINRFTAFPFLGFTFNTVEIRNILRDVLHNRCLKGKTCKMKQTLCKLLLLQSVVFISRAGQDIYAQGFKLGWILLGLYITGDIYVGMRNKKKLYVEDKRDYLFASWCGWFRAPPTRAEYLPKVKLLMSWRDKSAKQRAKMEEMEAESQTKRPPRILYPSLLRAHTASSDNNDKSAKCNNVVAHTQIHPYTPEVSKNTPSDTPLPWMIHSCCAWPSQSSPREYNATASSSDISHALVSSAGGTHAESSMGEKNAFLHRKHTPVHKVVDVLDQHASIGASALQPPTTVHKNISCTLQHEDQPVHHCDANIHLPHTRLGDICLSEYGTKQTITQGSPVNHDLTISLNKTHANQSDDCRMDLSEVLVQYSPFFQWATSSSSDSNTTSDKIVAETTISIPAAPAVHGSPADTSSSAITAKQSHQTPVWSGSFMTVNKRKLPPAASHADATSAQMSDDFSHRNEQVVPTPTSTQRMCMNDTQVHTRGLVAKTAQRADEFAHNPLHIASVSPQDNMQDPDEAEHISAEDIAPECASGVHASLELRVCQTETQKCQPALSEHKHHAYQHDNATCDRSAMQSSNTLVNKTNAVNTESSHEQCREENQYTVDDMNDVATDIHAHQHDIIPFAGPVASNIVVTEHNLSARAEHTPWPATQTHDNTLMLIEKDASTTIASRSSEESVLLTCGKMDIERKQSNSNGNNEVPILTTTNVCQISPLRRRELVRTNALGFTPITLTLPKHTSNKVHYVKRSGMLD